GRVGSGKSTVAKLLLGLYEPDSGSILVDQTDMRQIDPVDLRANIGTVLQDVWLFSGTIRSNIALGGFRPTDDEILQAAEIAGVHDFVKETPNGYDLVIRERGEGLSGGQRQAIAIARALLGNPSVLIMDEPTSMMDMQSEQMLMPRLADMVNDKTLILMTHRPALLSLVDRVIVMDHGKVVADGPKDILNRQAAAGRQPADAESTAGKQAANQ
ncbi:MAG: ATP-binding cassette domain-containing protein, partial [Kiloniellales bacterium]|nr:ATP-binding cassette domain-containing protein [Kiloniellales bacterium]